MFFTDQKHSHSNTNIVDDETKRRRLDASKKYRCICTCCHRKNLIIRSRELPNTDFSGFKGLY